MPSGNHGTLLKDHDPLDLRIATFATACLGTLASGDSALGEVVEDGAATCNNAAGSTMAGDIAGQGNEVAVAERVAPGSVGGVAEDMSMKVGLVGTERRRNVEPFRSGLAVLVAGLVANKDARKDRMFKMRPGTTLSDYPSRAVYTRSSWTARGS